MINKYKTLILSFLKLFKFGTISSWIISFFIFFAYCFYFYKIISPTKYLDCGIILKKSTEEVNIKNGSKTELYLLCEFEKNGVIAKRADITTYLKYNKGDNICFSFYNKIDDNINFNICSFMDN